MLTRRDAGSVEEDRCVLCDRDKVEDVVHFLVLSYAINLNGRDRSY